MAKRDQRISELEAKLRALKSEATRQKVRQRVVNARKERTQDTRRKILLGAWLMRQLERGEFSRDALMRALESYLERDEDRALFDLAPQSAASVRATSADTAAGVPSFSGIAAPAGRPR